MFASVVYVTLCKKGFMVFGGRLRRLAALFQEPTNERFGGRSPDTKLEAVETISIGNTPYVTFRHKHRSPKRLAFGGFDFFRFWP
jgi:hypothetical protein